MAYCCNVTADISTRCSAFPHPGKLCFDASCDKAKNMATCQKTNSTYGQPCIPQFPASAGFPECGTGSNSLPGCTGICMAPPPPAAPLPACPAFPGNDDVEEPDPNACNCETFPPPLGCRGETPRFNWIIGVCDAPKPRLLDGMAAHAKWSAWMDLGGMASDDAKTQYVELVEALAGGPIPTVGNGAEEGDASAY